MQTRTIARQSIIVKIHRQNLTYYLRAPYVLDYIMQVNLEKIFRIMIIFLSKNTTQYATFATYYILMIYEN